VDVKWIKQGALRDFGHDMCDLLGSVTMNNLFSSTSITCSNSTLYQEVSS